MATDYVLFVHGVKTRSQEAFQQTCLGLLESIRRSLNDSSRTLKPIFLFWGDLNVAPQQKLVQGLKASPQWQNLLFRDFRSQEIVEFVGDAALYLSRHVGAQVQGGIAFAILPWGQWPEPVPKTVCISSPTAWAPSSYLTHDLEG